LNDFILTADRAKKFDIMAIKPYGLQEFTEKTSAFAVHEGKMT
jgi:hypothetical protein